MLDRSPNSPRASAKPSCTSPRRVRKRSNICDCYSEKQVDRASGKAFALPGYGGLRKSGRTAVQDSLRLKNRLFFFRAGKLALYQHSTTAHRSFLEYAPIRFAFMGAFQWGQISCSFLYLLLVIGSCSFLYLLLSIKSLEQFGRHRVRATSQLFCPERGLHSLFFFLSSFFLFFPHVCVPS